MQTEAFEDSHVTTVNSHFGADTSALEAHCGTTLQYTGINPDGTPIDRTNGSTIVTFNTITSQLEYESQDYSRVGNVITGMVLQVGYPGYLSNGFHEIQIAFIDICDTPVSFAAGQQQNPNDYLYDAS